MVASLPTAVKRIVSVARVVTTGVLLDRDDLSVGCGGARLWGLLALRPGQM